MKQAQGIPLNQLLAQLVGAKPSKSTPRTKLTLNYTEARDKARKSNAR